LFVACLSENQLLDYVQGRLALPARADIVAHADHCPSCSELIAHALDALHATPLADGVPPDGRRVPMELDSWKRYRLIGLIGAGGAGDVYKAHDPQLRRTVAVKILRREDERFLVEAQAQARVEHENVCKVYEVGTINGRPFIAMQYIEGRTLAVAAAEMTVDERVRVIARVADAIEAAHRLDIIHRDLKPSNILVERTVSGWKPYVMDFGLAREISETGGTVTGALVGTPLYMAPEQARGQVRLLDRRTDVYGLGATLYAVLVGRPPFAGPSTMDLLLRIVQDEPTPPRRLLPELPRDLETVMLKCLEKDPRLRYASAAALARDLDAFLRGEPVAARPQGRLSRLARKANRHRRLTGLVVVAMAVIATLAGVALNERRMAAARARLARDLTDETRQIESTLRIASLLPLHDATAERELIRQHIAAIESKMKEAGPAGRGLGLYALGRGYLALRDYEHARTFLQQAYDAHERDPGLEYALGLVLGHDYQKELAALGAFKGPERQSRRRELVATYRDPALSHLRKADGPLDSSTYLEGLIAYYDDRFDVAAERAHEAFRRRGWLYEALQLEGDAHMAMGDLRRAAGDRPGARARYLDAGEHYREAIELGRSDDLLYLGDCRRVSSMVRLDVEEGHAAHELVEQGLVACRRALLVNPDQVDALEEEANLLINAGAGETERPRCQARYQDAIAAADRAAARAPDWLALTLAGEARVFGVSECEAFRSGDPRASLSEGLVALDRAMGLRPTSRAERARGVAFRLSADRARADGRDPLPDYDHSIAAYRHALALATDIGVGYVDATNLNLGNVLESRAQYEASHGRDPRPTLTQAAACLAQSIAQNPTDFSAINTRGAIEFDRAVYDVSIGADPSRDVDDAISDYRRCTELNPRFMYCDINLAEAAILQARYLLDAKRPADEPLAWARRALDHVEPLHGVDHWVWLRRCQLELVAAQSAAQTRAPTEPPIRRAGEACQRALAIDRREGEALESEARLHAWLAERATIAARRRDEIALGARAATEALAVNGESAEAHALAGCLEVLKARDARDDAQKTSARRATALFERAFHINASIERKYRPWSTEARAIAAR
jgi:serine/threonine-protein kinase